uniref:Uncharacterized protein n=1 Tax=Arundo donax TaxID=35708 RepID=A0A0A9GXE1_ARUDO
MFFSNITPCINNGDQPGRGWSTPLGRGSSPRSQPPARRRACVWSWIMESRGQRAGAWTLGTRCRRRQLTALTASASPTRRCSGGGGMPDRRRRAPRRG